jgi:hypothetical protein
LVPECWLKTHESQQFEFILLSIHVTNTKSATCKEIKETDPKDPNQINIVGIEHAEGCEHQSKYNVMLIDWKQGPQCDVAVRVGITQIHRDDWARAETTRKLIVLS